MSDAIAETSHLEVGIAAGGNLRWAAVDLTAVVEEGRRRLDLSPLAAVALGRCATAAALLLRLSVKRTERISVEARGDGPMRRVYAEVRDTGDVRGLVGSPQIATPEGGGGLRLGPALGQGLLRVRREERLGARYDSQVRLETGEIGTDLAHFLEQSEQRRSAVLLGVLTRPEGIAAAGGILVEALPDATPETIRSVEVNVTHLDSVSRRLEEEGIEGVLATILAGFDRQLLESRELRYACGCSKEKLAESLTSLSVDELTQLLDEQGELRAECAFCGEIYRYQLEELVSGDAAN